MNKKSISKFLQENVLTPIMSNLEKVGQFLFLEREILKGKSGLISFGAVVIYFYEKGNKRSTVRAKSRITKEATPTNLHFVYKITFKTTLISADYKNLVNNLLIKAGLEPDFEPEETYSLHFQKSKIVLCHKDDIEKVDEDKRFYIRVYDKICKGYPQNVYFDADLNVIDPKDVEKIKAEYLPQAKKDELIGVRNHKVENVIYAKHGDFKIEDAPIDDLKTLLKQLLEKLNK